MRETALSTMEVEINTLSCCCRELFPLMNMVGEVRKTVGMATKDMTSMYVSMHEDNAGALILAKTLPPKCTHWSKYYATKTVWFREEMSKRKVKLLKIETKEHFGDLFTKGLFRPQFEYLRFKMMG